MKKAMVLFLSLVLAIGLCACGSGVGQEQGSSTASSETEEDPDTGSESAETEGSGVDAEGMDDVQAEEGTPQTETEEQQAEGTDAGKTLVVYYSASGNTKQVAEYIAAAVNADTFELVPAEPYSGGDLDWTDDNSRVVQEHEDPDAREVELEATEVPDWESYETVFIGYPIWWGIAAWPVDTFIKGNDFTGKTVIPFCTSASSGLGESGTLLEEMAGTGNWLAGERFSSGVSEDDVREWVESIDIAQ